ncbi:hypothetical protein MN116_002221 [Schistosoma mekongi]|uniref:Leucine-rich repeat-containing protein n=1 Tax=Schistosoma mekongi TaxID=38744 RepID=A0AAE2D9J0_SCHME|nr:hypothetical protein MN116_002221 [Schistosoma mekongi]
MLDISIAFKKLDDTPKNDTAFEEFSFCDYHAQRQGNFSCRRLKDISTFFETFKFLEGLNLSKNLITNIPSGIEQYRLLTFLDLSFNKIFSIPSALCKLANLRILLISNNYLSSLPPNISDLQCLQELDLSSNKFKFFPYPVCSFNNLKVLLLGCNLIGILPEEIIGLRHLRILDIHSNQLKQLPTNIRFMLCLERLSLEENPLSFPPLTIITRGIPYIFAYLNQHAECNSNNASCEKFPDSLTEPSTLVVITSNRHNTMKQSDSQFEESVPSSPYFEKPNMNTESVQRSLSSCEVTNPSTLQNFTYSTVSNKKEQLHEQNENQYLSPDCTRIEQSIHDELTDSCLNETLKSGSSISSLSTDDEPLTVEMCCSTYENINFDKSESRNDSSQELINITTTIDNSQIKQPVSTYNGISKEEVVSTTSLDENDDVVSNNSGVDKVNSYILTDETSPSYIKSINDDQAEDYSTSHLCSKYDRLAKKSVISRSRCSKHHQIIHDRNIHSSSGYITPNSHRSESYSTSQMNVYRRRSVSQCHTNEQSDNSMNSTHALYNPCKNNLYNEDISNKTCVGVALYMPTECTLKKPPMFQSTYNHQLQMNRNCQDFNVSYTTGYLSNNVNRSNNTYNINTSESTKANPVNYPVKWEELNSNELSKINQLRRIIDKELNIRLPINPKQLAIELCTGVILIHLVNKFIGTTSKNIKVCVPRNDQRTNLLNEVIKSYRRNLRRCREWIHRYGVPRECLFSTESVVNPQTADGLLSLANSITIMYNIRNNTKSTINTSYNKIINNFITNTDSQYHGTLSQVQTTSPPSQEQQQQRQSSHHPLHHQQQLTKKTVNNRRLYHMNIWPNHLCSDV